MDINPFSPSSLSRPRRSQAGGFLEVRYVRLSEGTGIRRARIPLFESAGGGGGGGIFGNEVIEKRGSMLFVEPGARGGNFIGVYFDNDEGNVEAVGETIEFILSGTGYRAYGGLVFIAGGELSKLIFYFLFCSLNGSLLIHALSTTPVHIRFHWMHLPR